MTPLASLAGALVAAGALALAAVLGTGPGGGAEHPAAAHSRAGVVVDAAVARHGRDLLDPRLKAAGADVRVARSADEARTDVRYLAAAGEGALVVVGPRSAAAAREAGVPALRAPGVAEAMRALRR
jgi:uroporphyrinogen-III synthase